MTVYAAHTRHGDKLHLTVDPETGATLCHRDGYVLMGGRDNTTGPIEAKDHWLAVPNLCANCRIASLRSRYGQMDKEDA